jgi:hypothetical protein
MDAFSFADSLAQSMNAFQVDDSTVAVLALLVGIIGGYQITGWHTKLMKAKRAKVGAQRLRVNRKPD